MRARAAGLPSARTAFLSLTRTFLRRFFDNEITGGTRDLTSSFFWLVGFVGGPFALMPIGAMIRYPVIALKFGPEALRLSSRPDKVFVIALGMVVSALVAAVAWHSLMLERRDGLILGVLPVRGRTVVAAKIAALAVYVIGIAAAMHAIPSVIYGVILSDRTDSLRLAVLGPVAHLAATVSACAFVFLSVTAAQGLALALLGPAAFRRVSSFLQAALVASVVIGVTKIPAIVHGVAEFNRPGPSRMPASWLFLAPPVWFLGLYEWILGGAAPVYATLAATAASALAAVTAVTLAAYFVVYRRVMARVVETPEDAGGSGRFSAAIDWATRRLARAPVRRAAAQFFFASVGRVERLRFVVAVTVGVLCAWIVPAVVLLTSAGVAPSVRTTFGLSYAAMALVLIGLRIAVSMPADLRASWMLPVVDAPGRVLRSGLWRALYLSGIVPIVLGFAVLDAWLWTWPVALTHAGIMLAMGALLLEIALWHFDDLSNCRPWRPEGAGLRMWWPAYLFGFATLTGTVPHLEWLSRDSLAGVAAMAAGCLGAAAVVRIAHRRPYPIPSLDIETFVEPPRVLGLD